MKSNLKTDIIDALKTKRYLLAETMIKKLSHEDLNSPWPHFYLGILAECQDQSALAMRHYRAALAMDGTHRPSLNNLYRCGDGKKSPIDFGLEG